MKVNCFLYHLLLFWERFLCQEVKQITLKFLKDFCLIFWHQDHFQNNYKNGGKNSPSHKNKRHLFSHKILKKFKQNLKKKILSNIHNLFLIHQVCLTYFSYFEAYLCSIFHFFYISLYFTFSIFSFVPHKTTENTTKPFVFTKTLT